MKTEQYKLVSTRGWTSIHNRVPPTGIIFAEGAIRHVLGEFNKALKNDKIKELKVRQEGVVAILENGDECFLGGLEPQVAHDRFREWQKKTREKIQRIREELASAGTFGEGYTDRWQDRVNAATDILKSGF